MAQRVRRLINSDQLRSRIKGGPVPEEAVAILSILLFDGSEL